MDKPVVGDTARNPQNPDLEGLKLCPKTHPYAYRNGTACCGGPGYGIQVPGSEDFVYYGNFRKLEWSDLTCDGGVVRAMDGVVKMVEILEILIEYLNIRIFFLLQKHLLVPWIKNIFLTHLDITT